MLSTFPTPNALNEKVIVTNLPILRYKDLPYWCMHATQ